MCVKSLATRSSVCHPWTAFSFSFLSQVAVVFLNSAQTLPAVGFVRAAILGWSCWQPLCPRGTLCSQSEQRLSTELCCSFGDNGHAPSWSTGDNREMKTCQFLEFYRVTAEFGSSTMFRTSMSRIDHFLISQAECVIFKVSLILCWFLNLTNS